MDGRFVDLEVKKHISLPRVSKKVLHDSHKNLLRFSDKILVAVTGSYLLMKKIKL